MKTDVWSRMPFDVLEKVLLRLPLASQARFRAVSKAARWLLSSERFQLERAKVGVSWGRLPVYALVRSDELSEEGVDVLSELQVPYKVHKLSLGFLPAEFRVLEGTDGCELYFGKGVIFFAKDLLNKNGHCVGHRICVVNPINQSWRQLPDLVFKSIFLELGPLATASLTGEEDGAFQVFVLHCLGPHSLLQNDNTLFALVSVYSSRTHAWRSKLIRYNHPESKVTLAQADLVVGDEYVYALGINVMKASHFEAELFRASSGKHVRQLAPPPFNVESYELGLVQLEQGECMVVVPCSGGTCRIMGLPDHTSEDWDEVSALPKDLAMKMAPGDNLSDDEYANEDDPFYAGSLQFPYDVAPSWVMDLQVAGTFLVLSQAVSRKPHVAVYDYLLGTWKIVLSRCCRGEDAQALLPWERVLDSSNYKGIVYLELRPRFRLGMADCTPE